MNSKVPTRVLYGAIMIAALAGLLYLDWWIDRQLDADGPAAALYCLPTTIVLLGVVILGFLELARLAGAAGVKLLGVSGMLATVALASHPYWQDQLWRSVMVKGQIASLFSPVMVLILSFLAMFAEQMIRFRLEDALRRVAATLLAVLYLGVGGMFIFYIRNLSVQHLVLFLMAVKCTDIGAYFTGTAIGKHKMIAWLSPGKSWEGLIGGLVFAAGICVFAGWALGIEALAVWQRALFGVIVGLAGQFGDLCESLLKRSAKVKDSGAVVPEFGGVLDIIDSPLLAAPIALILLAILQ